MKSQPIQTVEYYPNQKLIALSQWGWAISESDVADARKRIKRQTPRGKKTGDVKLYAAHPETVVFGDGSWEFPNGKAPVLL